MNALYLIGFVQSIFFMILILTKRKVELKDYILSLYILILGLNLIFMYLSQIGFHQRKPMIIILDFAYWTLLGPLLYLYIEFSTSKKPVIKWKHVIHLFPLIFILLAFSDYFLTGYNETFYSYQNDSIIFNAGYIVWMYNSPVYYILSIFKLRPHRKRVKEYFSSLKDVDLKWLNYLVHGFAVFLFFLLFRGYLFRILNMEVTINRYHFTWLIMVIYIFGIGFFGYKQKGIFSDLESVGKGKLEPEKLNTVSNEPLKEQYLKSGLKDEEAKQIQERLVTIMRSEKPYLEYDITLPKLAQQLDTTSHKLSQVINEKYNTNFFEFINRYRISDLKKLLTEPKNANVKIMALAYDCGFNSKSAFYAFFKKETSLTPTKFRQKKLGLTKV